MVRAGMAIEETEDCSRYHIHHHTPGVITACALSVPPLPRNVDVALLSVPDFEAVERCVLINAAIDSR